MSAVVPARPATIVTAGVFFLQGVGYAVVVTALPSFQGRLGLGAGAVALILLGVCVTAALGSLLADLIAVRRNSRAAVVIALSVQAASLTVVALAPGPALFVAAVLAYGLGLGAGDASSNMQGVLVQRRVGAPFLGRLYAANTSGAILGALGMTGALLIGIGAVPALLAAAALHVVFLVAGAARLDPERAARRSRSAGARPARLPSGAIVVTGLVVLAAFTLDSAVSSWSAVHLAAIGAAAALTPVGYAVYQAVVLVVRLILDPLVRRVGARAVMAGALAAGGLGGVVVVIGGGPAAAIVGFALSGLTVGVLVPLAFARAGRIEPARSDEVIARVNLFNYAGAVLGAVGTGVVIEAGGASLAFLLPALLLAAAVPALVSARR